jgi:hypothetical protein
MFRWGGRYLNSMPFQTGFAINTILQGSDQAKSQTSSSISGKCNNLTLQLRAVSERIEEHILNFARISPESLRNTVISFWCMETLDVEVQTLNGATLTLHQFQ